MSDVDVSFHKFLIISYSFESRSSIIEADPKNMAHKRTIELQKLGVVPQTVFLKAGADNASRPLRVFTGRRNNSELSRTPVLGTPRSARTMSMDYTAGAPGAPFEDLRRRLAMINGSATSLSHTPSVRDARSPILAPPDNLTPPNSTTVVSDLPVSLPVERPISPTESLASVSNTSFPTAFHRLHIGSTDSQKAAPAVGSSKANATGLLDAHSKPRDGSPERSGRSSPVSISGTVRGLERPRLPSLAPISSYDGREPGINNLLEHMYLDNNRELQSEFGPRVHEGPIRRRNAARHSYISRDGGGRRIETNLVAHLGSHTDAITGVAVSPDHMFFISASDDKTVKIWDSARLERNVTSKARHTYGQHHAKVKAVCAIEGTHCFASAAEDGNIHVVRVHVTTGQGAGAGLPKYGRLQMIREHRLNIPGEYVTYIAHYTTSKRCNVLRCFDIDSFSSEASSSNLLYATTHSTITIMEIRTMRVLQTMHNPRHFGPITSMCIDRKRTWIVCGTATGVLSLWDLRFGILIKTWSAGASAGDRPVTIHQCSLHPTKGKGRWIMVALGSPRVNSDQQFTTLPNSSSLVEVWDIEKFALVEIYGTRTVAAASDPLDEPSEIKALEAERSPATAIAALVRERQEIQESSHTLLSRRRSSSQKSPPLLDLTSSNPSPAIIAFAMGSEFGGHTTLHRSPMAEQDDAASGRATGGGRGFMICGSEDRKLRLLDLNKVERSVVLSSPDGEGEKPIYG